MNYECSGCSPAFSFGGNSGRGQCNISGLHSLRKHGAAFKANIQKLLLASPKILDGSYPYRMVDELSWWVGTMLQKITRFLWNEDGPTAVEYAVMLALLIGMCIAAIALAGGPVTAFWTDSSNEFGNAVNN